MTDTPQWVLNEIQRVKDEGLTKLDLSVLGHKDREPYNQIPEEIFSLTHLKELTLNELQGEIPDKLSNLGELSSLSLMGDYSEIPKWIGNLSQLTSLQLIGRYSEIPEQIGNLSQLTDISFSGRYSEIPEWIGNLSQLTQLFLIGDYSEIPEWIGNLSQLTQLTLSGNYDEILDEISNLNQLRLLQFDGLYSNIPEILGNLNQLITLLFFGSYSKIPSSIINIQELEALYISSKKEILSPPPAVIGNDITVDIEAMRQYFADIASEATIPLYEAKLLVVGEPNAGKTTLACKIEDENAPMPEPKATTRGIDVIRWDFPMDNGENFRVNIWDFGGQEIYKATHQFFLTKDSVYALVLDNRKEDDNLVYWLHAVELLSENSPLLIVKNERDKRVRQLNERQYKERFSNIRDIKDTDLNTNQGLPAIKNAIKQYMQELPHFGTPLPQSWVQIRTELEKDTRNFVTYDEYLKICAVNNLRDTDKAKNILGYLHNLGVCLHFEDDELLSQLVILKPEWATTAVYAVLDNNDVIKNYGIFTLNDLKAIWQETHYKDMHYKDMHYQLLNLMKKFQLCYPIEGTNNYIAPQLLADNQRDYDWDNRENLMLRYKYDFMPKGIFSRLIVVMHQLIDNDTVWKTGVVLRQNNAYAEIKENYKGNEIMIRTRGANRDGLLFHIMLEIENLHRPFGKQLKVSKHVPCNCSSCMQDIEPEFYEYTYIDNLAQRDKTVPCPRSFEDVDAKSLIKEIHYPKGTINLDLFSTDFADRRQSVDYDILQKMFLQRQKLDINIHNTIPTTVQAPPQTVPEPQKDEEKEQLEQEIKKFERDDKKRKRNTRFAVVGVGLLIMLAVIWWWLPNVIEWTWLITHPYQIALQIQASIICVCLGWMAIIKDNSNRIAIGIMILTIISTVASFIIPQVS